MIKILIAVFVSIPLFAFPQEEEEKKFILVEYDILSEIKNNNYTKIKEGKIPQIKDLLKKADLLLYEGPYSVTYKKQLPPSGDIHDYTSMGPYWWPDPDKKEGLPYIRRDGEINPEYYDYKDREQLGKLMSALKILSEAYYFSEKEEYAAHAVGLLRAWFLDPETKMNPNLNFAQRIPGRTEGRGIGIIDTRSFSDLPDVIGLLSTSRHWKVRDEEGMKQWLGEYVHWLTNSKHGKDEAVHGNNHTTWYFAQTIPLALYIGNVVQADSLANAGLPLILDEMIAEDGSQPLELSRTKSWDYSAMNLMAMFYFAKASEHIGLNVWELENSRGVGLRQALDFMVPYAKKEKEWEFEQINDLEFEKLKYTLNMAALKYQHENYKQLADQLRSGHGYPGYFDLASYRILKQ